MKEETKKGYLKLLKLTLGSAVLMGVLVALDTYLYPVSFPAYVVVYLGAIAGFAVWFKKA